MGFADRMATGTRRHPQDCRTGAGSLPYRGVAAARVVRMRRTYFGRPSDYPCLVLSVQEHPQMPSQSCGRRGDRRAVLPISALFVVLAMLAGGTASARADGIFVADCNFSHRAADDPI